MIFKLIKTQREGYIYPPAEKEPFIMTGEDSDLVEGDLIELEDTREQFRIEDILRREGVAEEVWGISLSDRRKEGYIEKLKLGTRYFKIVASSQQ